MCTCFCGPFSFRDVGFSWIGKVIVQFGRVASLNPFRYARGEAEDISEAQQMLFLWAALDTGFLYRFHRQVAFDCSPRLFFVRTSGFYVCFCF